MATILFYVSGHGYGHAVRMGEVIRALQRIRPEWRILVRTKAPRQMFPATLEFSEAEFESRVHEREAGVVMDEEATRADLTRFLARWDTVLAAETIFAREQQVDLVVADIPAIAGDIAHQAGVPCVAISNFTWDWIFEPYADGQLQCVESAYSKMSLLLRLPFHQPSRLDVFPRIVDAPLIARKTPGGIKPESGRRRALLGSRAQVSPDALARAAASAPEFELVTAAADVPFSDLLASCDVVIAKLGFSMIAECIAARKRLLYPPREHFREETILQQHVHQHLTAEAIPLPHFYAGEWGPYLRTLCARPHVVSGIRTDGAEFCARFLAEWPLAS